MKMKHEQKLMEQVKALLLERAQKSLEIARKNVLEDEKIEYPPLREALRYFMENWHHVSHPTLISLSCEAVGGNPDAGAEIGAALILVAGAADAHDDIIDQSVTKDSKLTVYGKFGKDLALLIGDALLFKGLLLLHEACEPLKKNQQKAILQLTKYAFFEIGKAEAQEASLRGRLDLPADEYRNIIRTKVSVSEAAAKIGAILGNGTPEEIETLGYLAKTLGLLMTIRDEFIDIFELDELSNRFKNECLPLPVLYAFQDPVRKKMIIRLLKRKKMTEADKDRITELVVSAEATRKLRKEMNQLIRKATRRLCIIHKNRDLFKLLLESTAENLAY
jgi:geranylgeranyl diphosphate synthase type I